MEFQTVMLLTSLILPINGVQEQAQSQQVQKCLLQIDIHPRNSEQALQLSCILTMYYIMTKEQFLPVVVSQGAK